MRRGVICATTFPDFPGGVTARVQIVQVLFFLVGVHASPEAFVAKYAQLLFGNQASEGGEGQVLPGCMY